MMCTTKSPSEFAEGFPFPSYFASESFNLAATLLETQQVHLKFADLVDFQMVQDHYESLGVRFEGAIAIYPSNPAFVVRPNALVLTPVSDRGITISFQQPQTQVSAWVVGAKQTKMTAYTTDHKVFMQCSTGQSSRRAESDRAQSFTANQMILTGQSIIKIRFYSHAPFILDHFTYG
jgi:hypothetical protein